MIFFKIIRPINLFLIALSLIAIRIWLIAPVLHSVGIVPFLSTLNYSLLILSVICIAAAGNIINDIFDYNIDVINKPNNTYVNESNISWFLKIYYTLNLIAVAIILYIAFLCKNLSFASIHLIAIGLLWWYSASLKKMALVGNLAIALLSTLVIIVPIIFEPIIFLNQTPEFTSAISVILICFAALCINSFFITLAREIVKDCIDIQGDLAYNCNTLPIKIGINKSLSISAAMLIPTMVLCIWFIINTWYLKEFSTMKWYMIISILLPTFITTTLLLFNSQIKFNLNRISNLLKIIILFGILFIYFIFKWFN